MASQYPISWQFDTSNPVISPGQIHGDLDAKRASAAHVLDMGDHYRMYYWGTGSDGYNRILMATCARDDLHNWKPAGSILERQPDTPYNEIGPSFPHVVSLDENRYLLYFAGWGCPRPDGKLPNTTGVAVSTDGGMTFSYVSDTPMLELDRSWDKEGTGSICILKTDHTLRMYYTALGRYFEKPEGIVTAHSGMIPEIGIGYAESEDGLRWTKPLDHLVVSPRGFDTSPYEYIVSKPFIMQGDAGYRMWVNTCGIAYRMRSLTSSDGLVWQWNDSSLDGEMNIGAPGSFDDRQRCYVSIINAGDTYHCWYTGNGYGGTGMGYASGVPGV